MPEIIKYLSPVAILGLIWAIIQFYQKRRDDRRESVRKEKLIVYNAIHSVLRDIEFELIQFMSSSKIPMFNVEKEIKSGKEIIASMDKMVSNIKKEMEIQKNQEGFNEKAIDKLDIELENTKVDIDEIIIKLEEVTNKNVEEITPIFQNLILSLKTKMEEINRIPILILPKKNVLESIIFDLTNEITALLEKFGTEKHMDEKGFPNLSFMGHFKNLFDISQSIKSLIEKDLNR